MKKFNILLAVLVVMMIMSAGIGSAWAYFTTYAEAVGGYTIELGESTRIEEDFSNWTKTVNVAADEGSDPVYVRVKAFCGSQYELVYSDESGLWTPGEDGYYYYSEPIANGEVTSNLLIKIENVPADVVSGDEFNVIVIYEYTPVLYDEQGNPYCDWNVLVDSNLLEGGD